MTGVQRGGASYHWTNTHQGMGAGASTRLFSVLVGAGIDEDQADGLIAAVEAGAITGAYSWTDANGASDGRSEAYAQGWSDAVTAVCAVLASVADTSQRERGRAAAARRLARHRAARPPAGTDDKEGDEGP
ncbi:hypothetical protein ACH4OX_36290 [Streptomyces roseolus]|uniref:hypothetical protein n=1 Tax=Streptomyces roseolus TaxID=67358 RepID=UPI0037A9ADF6